MTNSETVQKNSSTRQGIMVGLLLSFLFLFSPVQAETTVVTNPVGMFKLGAYDQQGNYLGLLSNSDTLVGLPLTRPPEYVGVIQAVSANTVTVSGTPGWTDNQFVYAKGTQSKTYYALIGAGSGTTNPKEGCIYTVTANTNNSLTLDLNGDDIQTIPANSQITLIPYWTVGTLFPASDANVSFTPSPNPLSPKTQIFIPNYAGSGINLGSSANYYYISSGSNIGWRLAGKATTEDHEDDILIPDGYIIVRNKNNAATLPLVVTGCVITGKITISLATQVSTKQDNLASNLRPVNVSLNDCGLNPSAGNFVASTNPISHKDEIILFDNSFVCFNKAAYKTYYYINSGSNIGWRLAGDSITTDHGTDLIPASSAMLIRKAAANAGAVFWQNSPTY